MATRRIKLLGTIVVEENGIPSRIMDSDRGCALLAHLIVSQQTLRRELVADLLWDAASSTSQSRQRLRELLTRVRKWIPEIEATRQTVSFNPKQSVEVDFLLIQDFLRDGSFAALESACWLYDGDLLSTFHLAGTPRFNEWLLLERDRLRRQILAAFKKVTVAYLEQDAWADGITIAQRWIEQDPLNEEAYRITMMLLARSGQHTAITPLVERCRQRLWDELAVEPDRLTLSLAAELLAEDRPVSNLTISSSPRDILAAETLPAAGLLPESTNLPYHHNPDFVGRDDILLQIANQIAGARRDGRPPAIAITGMGGVGKTQTAVEFCYRYGRFFTGGVIWLSFADPSNVADEIARSGSEHGINLFTESSLPQLADRVAKVRRAWQEPTPRLLIFDNCESESLLQEWLPVTGGCTVIITCRRRLFSRALGVNSIPLTPLEAADSHLLLQKLARRLQPAEVANIATILGHLPLALHLAGNFLNRYEHITAEQFVAQLNSQQMIRHPSLTGRGQTYSPTGHELNLAKTFALSMQEFQPDDEIDQMALALLARLVAFAPGEPIPRPLLRETLLLEPTSHDADLMVEDSIQRLLELGLVHADGQHAIVIHRLLADYARHEFEADGSFDEARRDAEQACVNRIAHQWQREINLSNLPIPAVHLYHLADAAIPHRELNGSKLNEYLARHLLDLSDYSRAKPYAEEAIDIGRDFIDEHGAFLAVNLTTYGAILWRQHNSDEAWPYFQEANAICKRVFGPLHPNTAQSNMNLAVLLSRGGRLVEADKAYLETLAIYEETKSSDDLGTAMLLLNMVANLVRLGKLNRAKEYGERCLGIREQALNPVHPDLANILNALGNIHYYLGNHAEGKRFSERSRAIRSELFGEHSLPCSHSLITICKCELATGNAHRAEELAEQVLSTRLKLLKEGHAYRWHARTYLAQAKIALHKLDEAKELLHPELGESAIAPGFQGEFVTYLDTLADLFKRSGEFNQSRLYLEKALTFRTDYYQLPHPDTLANIQGLAQWHREHGEQEAMQRYEKQAEKMSVALQSLS